MLVHWRGKALIGDAEALSSDIWPAPAHETGNNKEQPLFPLDFRYAQRIRHTHGRTMWCGIAKEGQLMTIQALHMGRAVFTVNNSFREENYDDPEV
jgi:hypothetical protein